MKVALVYDRVNKWGGAERVLLALKELFPTAPLYTSVYNSKTALWAKDFDIHTSFLQSIPFAKSRHEVFPFLMPLAFESFSLDEYDIVISVTSEAAKGIITKPSTKHICICLTPTRYLWNGYEEYFANTLFRFLSFPIVWYLRVWDKIASQRPDRYIAISEEVKKRIKKYYGKDSSVIFPPLMRNRLLSKTVSIEKGYYLVVSRLVAYKRVDLAIRACNVLGLPLKIIGSGLQEKELRRIAGPTVEFVGSVSEEALDSYYEDCQALIFPGLEEFGLTMVEAQAMGKPVIAYRGGGALEIVKERKTGEFFSKQTTESLVEVLKSFDASRYNKRICEQNAQRFSKKKFQEKILAVLK